jgi:hypothetical protein
MLSITAIIGSSFGFHALHPPALCQSSAKGYLLSDFYSGATGIPGRFIGPRVQDTWERQVPVSDLLHSRPRKSTSLASTHQRAVPTFDHV